MREKSVEARLVSGVKALDGLCVKLMPTVAGIPDRLVVLPGGRMIFVEVKAPGGRLREIQKVVIDRLRRLGVEVVVLTGTAEVNEWLKEVGDEGR